MEKTELFESLKKISLILYPKLFSMSLSFCQMNLGVFTGVNSFVGRVFSLYSIRIHLGSQVLEFDDVAEKCFPELFRGF